MKKPNCSECRHFYITWDPRTSNGCRRFGIQSKVIPSVIVREAGLGDCQGFEPKKKPQASAKELDIKRKDLW